MVDRKALCYLLEHHCRCQRRAFAVPKFSKAIPSVLLDPQKPKTSNRVLFTKHCKISFAIHLAIATIKSSSRLSSNNSKTSPTLLTLRGTMHTSVKTLVANINQTESTFVFPWMALSRDARIRVTSYPMKCDLVFAKHRPARPVPLQKNTEISYGRRMIQ